MSKQQIKQAFAENIAQNFDAYGFSRRDFLKFCTAITATMGLPFSMSKLIAKTIEDPTRPPVIWLHFQECTGCTESLLRATHPKVETLILDLISLDYSETLCAAAGYQVEEALHQSMEKNKGKYILVVEGSIPIKDNGIYCKIAGKTALESIKEVGEHCAAAIAIGSCASWGGVQSAYPNPTGATPLHKILKGKPIVNIPGCPPNPYNFLSTVLYYLTLGKLPELDSKGRPKFAYGRLIHENCERRPHFDAGRFAEQFGDDGHREGWCLYKLGCKGPETYANCPSILFGDVGSGSWPVGTGHPCFGCSEEGVGYTKPIHEQADVKTFTPGAIYPDIHSEKKGGVNVAGAAVTAGAVAIGAKLVSDVSKKLGEHDQKESSATKS
jgi:hydrogenase small subunit